MSLLFPNIAITLTPNPTNRNQGIKSKYRNYNWQYILYKGKIITLKGCSKGAQGLSV